MEVLQDVALAIVLCIVVVVLFHLFHVILDVICRIRICKFCRKPFMRVSEGLHRNLDECEKCRQKYW